MSKSPLQSKADREGVPCRSEMSITEIPVAWSAGAVWCRSGVSDAWWVFAWPGRGQLAASFKP